MTHSLAARQGDQGAGLTPTYNRNLRQRLGDFGSLVEALDYAAQGDTGFNFYSGRGQLDRVLPYAELRRDSRATARKLLSLGLKRGDRVAVVAETGADFMVTFFACQYAGLIPCPMPYSMHIGGKDAYVDRVAGMLRAGRACLVVSSEDLIGNMREAAIKVGLAKVLTHAELQAQPEAAAQLSPFGVDDDAYVQYSSGSTSNPKGVLISQKAIMANGAAILKGLATGPHDRGFSWLPLYHDMGLVGFCLSPLMGQRSIDYLATTAFARRPGLWLKLMSDNRSTMCFSPSFGFDLAARRVGADAASLDLSHLRVAGIGGDMVRADVLKLFADVMAVAGFRPEAFAPSYGMAETTLAITLADTAAPIRVDHIDRQALKTESRAIPATGDKGRAFVVCGKPVDHTRIEIRNGDGTVLGERSVGRLFVQTPSLMSGYFHEPEATAAVMGADGFFDTGDMGYWLDGEIVITGRAKDLILHNGRNIWPQDIEWAAEHIEPLRDGDVAAFAVEGDDGDDDVVVLVQCRLSKPDEIEKLRHTVAGAVHHSAGVECRVVMVPPKSLPFTSSGKLSRAGAKAKYLAGEIGEITTPAYLEAAQ